MTIDEPAIILPCPEAAESKRLNALMNCWREAAGEKPLPCIDSIDPIALKPFLKDLVVVCVSDPDQPRFRLFGSGYREFFGADYSGLAVREAPFPERDMMADTYRAVALSGKPAFGRYCWHAGTGGLYHSNFVILPYGDGEKVLRLVVMEDLDEARQVRAKAVHRMSA